MFRFSVSFAFFLLIASSIAEETSPKSSEKTRRDDSDSESSDSEDSTATSDAPPASINYANMRIPSFNFAPPPPHHHPHYPPPPPMYAQIPPPPPILMRMPMHNPHHNPYQMMPAASSFTAYYRPLPPPMPHMGHMMTSRMSLHPMHPLSPPFLPPPPPPRTLLPVMVPIKRWDHSSIFDSLINADPALDNSFLDEPLVFDEEELLAARRHISSPRPPPAHRRESYENFPIRRHKNRDGYEPMQSENRYDEPSERHAHKIERNLRRGNSEFEDRYERDPHDRHSERSSHMMPPPPPPPTSSSFERYEEHTARDAMHGPPADHMQPGDEYHSRDP